MADWKKIEAVLFASGKYLSEAEIKEYTGLKGKKYTAALNMLKKHYEELDSSLKLFQDDNSWKLNVKEEYNDVVQEVVSDAELPKSIMETLALIAYKSPVLQSEIVNTRGTNAYDHINYLIDKKFITKEPEGRSYKLKITEKFHEYFDIDDDQVRDVLDQAEKPDEDKLGELEVYDQKDESFDEKVLDRLKKPEEKENPEEQKEYLDEFDKKINSVKENIDEAKHNFEEIKEEKTEEESSSEKDELERDNYQDDTSEEAEEPEAHSKKGYDEEKTDESSGEDEGSEMSPEEVVEKVEKDIEEISKQRE